MKIKVLQENLSAAIAVVSRFVSSKAQMPVLEAIVFEAKDKELYLMATDMDKAVRMRVAAKVEQEGVVAVPGKLLTEMVKSLHLGAVEMEMKNGELEVLAGKMRSTLQVMEMEDFPELTFATAKDYWGELQKKEVVDVWKKAGMAVSRDVTRPVLTALLWELGAGQMVATDGYRLSVVKKLGKMIEAKKGVDQVLVPGEVWQELAQIVEKLGETKIRVGIVKTTGQLAFGMGEVEVVGKEVAGEYPNYKAIVPKSFATELLADQSELLAAVRAAAIFARDSSNIVKLTFERGLLKVSANSPQLGKSEIEVEVSETMGDGFEIAFNSKYLVDFLASVGEGQVKLQVNESLQPAKFSLEKDEGFFHVIMPVRVKE